MGADSFLLSATGESRKTKPELKQSRNGNEMIEEYETEEEDENDRDAREANGDFCQPKKKYRKVFRTISVKKIQ